jgi:ankyrin repeat protein
MKTTTALVVVPRHQRQPSVIPEVVPVQLKSKMLRAVKGGEYSMVWALLGKEASPNECEDQNGSGWAPLHWAAKDGNLPICQLLVSRGADVNIRDRSGQTPLHRAAYWGKLQVVDFLVYVGANTAATDSMNQTPSEVAFHRNNQEVYDYLQQQQQQQQQGMWMH